MTYITLKLTPYQAKLLWAVVDGAADAGACLDGSGNSERETEALSIIADKLLDKRAQWKGVN